MMRRPTPRASAVGLPAWFALRSRSRRAARVQRARRRLPGVPARQPLEPARRRPAGRARARRPLVRSIGSTARAPRLRRRPVRGRPIGIPYTTVSRRQRARAGVASTTRTSPTAAPTRSRRRADRGRRLRRRPPRDRRRPRPLPAVRAVRRLSARRRRRWRAGSGAIWNLRSNRLRPRGWTSADAAGLPILPGPGPLRGGRARRDRPRAPLHRRSARGSAFVYPGAPLRVATPAIRTCRRWACACGSRRASTSRASRARRGSSCRR